jgi:hypothetical protein
VPQVTLGPVDPVHDVRLWLLGRRRKGEVRVTSGFKQNHQLIVHTTIAAVATAVGQSPIAMDEGVPDATRGIAREVAMAANLVERLEQFFAQAGTAIAVMV